MTAFGEWMEEMDRACEVDLGVALLDLPDQPFRDWYDCGLTTAEAMKALREREGLEEC